MSPIRVLRVFKILLKNFKKALDKGVAICYNIIVERHAGMAQSVEHVIGNDEVISSILITSSKNSVAIATEFLFDF